MNPLTGNKDVDMNILMQLNDKDLVSVCSANKYVNKLCNDQNFWLKRIVIFYKISGPDLNNIKTYLDFNWKELYTYLTVIDYPYGFYKDNSILIDFLLTKQSYINEVIENFFMGEEFPKWINKQELIYQLRRDIPISIINRVMLADMRWYTDISSILDYSKNIKKTISKKIDRSINIIYPDKTNLKSLTDALRTQKTKILNSFV